MPSWLRGRYVSIYSGTLHLSLQGLKEHKRLSAHKARVVSSAVLGVNMSAYETVQAAVFREKPDLNDETPASEHDDEVSLQVLCRSQALLTLAL